MKNSEDKQIWECEFCLFKNEINIEDEEKPGEKVVHYLLEAAPVQDKKLDEESKNTNTDDTPMKIEDTCSVIFCVDISGSMAGYRLDYIKKAIAEKITSMN